MKAVNGVIFILALLLFGSPAWAAVTTPPAVSGNVNDAAATPSADLTLTIGSLTNGALFCGVSWDGAARTLNSVTWDADGTPQALTSIAAKFDGGSSRYIQWFYRAAPSAVTNGVVRATFDGDTSNVKVGCAAFESVDQTTPVRASTWNTASGAAVTITTVVDDVTMTTVIASGSVTSSDRTDFFADNTGEPFRGDDYHLATSTSTTHTWTASGASTLGTVGFSVMAAASGSTAVRRRPVMY